MELSFRTRRLLMLSSVFVVVFVVVKSLVTWFLEGFDAALAELPLAFVGAIVGAGVFVLIMRWRGKA